METNFKEINQKIESKLRGTRKIVSDLGNLLGKSICYITVDNVDLTHKEKEINNQHPRLVKPLKKYMVNTVTVSAQRILTIGEDLYVEFNGNEALRARITTNTKFFADATDVPTIESAIENAEINGTPMFFTDRKKLTAEVNFRNKNEMQKAAELAQDFLNQKATLKELIQNQQDSCDDYLSQYGL